MFASAPGRRISTAGGGIRSHETTAAPPTAASRRGKMNWNTFDYYSRLPATLDSASAIAKVGTYLSGFASAPYDYRLLI